MVLSPSAAVPLDNIAAYNSLGFHEESRSKIFVLAVDEGGTGHQRASHYKLNLIIVVQQVIHIRTMI